MAELVLKNIHYRYAKGNQDVLKGIDVSFAEGTLCSIRGRSGAGKSTLLHLLAGMDLATKGEILWDGKVLSKDWLAEYRKDDTGLIAQSYLLFPTRTALENVCYPLQLHGMSQKEAETIAKEHLLTVGIGEELHNRLPQNLSGGEQQRVAIARCLAGNYRVIVADEPTGNLDDENVQEVMNCLLKLAHEHGKLIIVVTHDAEVAALADKQYYLSKGILAPRE